MGSQEKLQTGRVVSNKMDKTVVVRIDRHKRHRLYGKTMTVTQRYKAHDEKNDANSVAETDPSRLLSRLAGELEASAMGAPLSSKLRVGSGRPAAVNSADDNVPS